MNLKILLVDDHRMLREGLNAILADEPDMDVVGQAEDGRSAIRLARELKPDVVIMDIGMRELNGSDATRQIVAENPNLHVVALSTYSDKVHVLGMLEAGATGYVIKSSAYDELRRAIRAVVGGNTYLSPEVAGAVVEAHLETRVRDTENKKELSPREREVLQLIAEGRTSAEIAERLYVSVATVDTHRRNIARKLDRHSVAELTKYAIRAGLTQIDS